MSESGTSRTLGDVRPESAKWDKADIDQVSNTETRTSAYEGPNGSQVAATAPCHCPTDRSPSRGSSMTSRSSCQSSPTFEVSRATSEDVASIQDVLYRVWLTTYPNKALGITVADIEEMYRDRNSDEALARIRERISSASEITLVAKENGKVVGVCRVIRREDKDVMEAIYVLPEYQRLGIGSAIWREIEKLLDSNRKIIVQVATYNTDAIEFYKRCGFRDTGKRWEEKKFRLRSGTAIPAMEMLAKQEQE
jgi:ribosomal protein S18 acetylase RimI-like enzyme